MDENSKFYVMEKHIKHENIEDFTVDVGKLDINSDNDITSFIEILNITYKEHDMFYMYVLKNAEINDLWLLIISIYFPTIFNIVVSQTKYIPSKFIDLLLEKKINMDNILCQYGIGKLLEMLESKCSHVNYNKLVSYLLSLEYCNHEDAFDSFDYDYLINQCTNNNIEVSNILLSKLLSQYDFYTHDEKCANKFITFFENVLSQKLALDTDEIITLCYFCYTVIDYENKIMIDNKKFITIVHQTINLLNQCTTYHDNNFDTTLNNLIDKWEKMFGEKLDIHKYYFKQVE